VAYVTTAQSLVHSARENLAALAQAVHVAPGIIPAANALISFGQQFYAPVSTSLVVQLFTPTRNEYAPLVTIAATTDPTKNTVLSYRSRATAMAADLLYGKILQNNAAPNAPLLGLSLHEVQAAHAKAAEKRLCAGG
jgi:hypothetical protein